MIGKLLGKRYELIEKVGEGGMGLVYKSRDHLLNRFVAVKILKPELTEDEEFINKFRKESLSSASLSHPNIVNIYDVGVDDGIYYIVMEYVKGKTLKEVIRERAPMPYYEIINISRQICLALEHAHNNNIIHRDIKPQNILITHDGIVKVADFGIARASNSSTLTNTGSVLGSVYYISPEQARGGYTDGKTDIYSLGTVMYEMAASKVPFQGESPVVVALKHIQEDVIKPSELNPDIPVALEDIILKALMKNSASRYESAAAMIRDLDRASANPNNHITVKYDNPNDITRVMPVIKESDIETNTSGEGRRKRSNKKKVNKGLIAGIAALVTIVIVSGVLIYMAKTGGRNEVNVPNIIGQSEDTAKGMLRQYGLNMEVKERRSSDQPEGTVIYTWPDIGMAVKKNTTVGVRLSSGPEKTEIPDVVNNMSADAVYKLEAKGLKANIIELNSEDVEKDKVIRQNPEAHTQVSSGATVDIYVSKGPEIKLVTIPQFEGVSYDKISSIPEYSKLKISVDYKSDPTRPDNVVLMQSVPKGTQVPEGSSISITVNKIVPTIPATS
jgi:Serine/threonine protein kinase